MVDLIVRFIQTQAATPMLHLSDLGNKIVGSYVGEEMVTLLAKSGIQGSR